MQKTKITSKEFAQGLLHVLKKFSDNFYEDFGQRAQKILKIEPDQIQRAILAREIYMIDLWCISKILSPDRKVLDELHKIYLLPHVNEDLIKQWVEQKDAVKLKEVLRQDATELQERYQKYYGDWDDNSSMQNILAVTMLEYMFNKGQPDRRFLSMDLQFFVMEHVYEVMKFIMDLREKHEIVD